MTAARNQTIRLQVSEVYEHGQNDFPLFICSDPTLAREQMQDGDRIVTSWWVREGGQI